MPQSDPERDRRLARQVRYGARRLEDIGDALKGFLGSEEMRRMRRFTRITPALEAALPAHLRAAAVPVRLHSGVLTIEVADTMAMHELRQHFATQALRALSSAGTGVSRIVWRLAARSTRGR